MAVAEAACLLPWFVVALNKMLIECESAMLNLSRDIDSLTHFKRNTNEVLAQLEATGHPMVLTINGKAKVVVQDVASYQRLLELLEQAETVAGIRAGLEDVKQGRTRPLDEVIEELERQDEAQD